MTDAVLAQAREWLDWAQNTVQPYFKINGPGVRPTLPPRSYFKFPPSNLPATLQPPLENPNFEHPFTIPVEWYNAALSPIVPVTFALVYVTVIAFLNSVNARRDKKPWAISKTWLFKLFVVTHNIFLSLYSLWTFVGMFNALRISLVDPREQGLAATVDSLCKLSGPRGFGSAATYNETTSTWGFTDRVYHLAADGLNPDSSDVGRIWNEGLSFYGWIFYLSKFYEVVDTLIIIAKGKTSSFLQTYHHAGAMLCMWAGIRYMSPPIWMFVTFNSFIHFVMYAFYTFTTIGIKVPKPLKKTLTTLQIAQFVIGASYAFGHYFVEYQMPISVPYIFHLGQSLQEATPSIKSDASAALSTATATASADVASWLKKLAFRAAGREGLAENVENNLGQTFGVDAVHAVEDFVQRQETRYRQDLQWVQCLDTSGQTFAIYLNIFYLLPLTWLFLQFFIKSYLNRAEERRRSSLGDKAHIAGRSLTDARKGVVRRLSEAFEDYQGANGEVSDDNRPVDAEVIRRDIRELVRTAEETTESVTEAVKEKTSKFTSTNVKKSVQENLEEFTSESRSFITKAQQVVEHSTLSEDMLAEMRKASDAALSVKKSVQNVFHEETTNNVADTVEKAQEQAYEVSADAESKAEEKINVVKEESKNVKQEVDQKAEELADEAEEKRTEVKAESSETAADPTASSQDKTDASATEEIEGESKVQEGKSFADAAAEGVSEEEKGDIKVQDDVEDQAVKKEEDEGA